MFCAFLLIAYSCPVVRKPTLSGQFHSGCPGFQCAVPTQALLGDPPQHLGNVPLESMGILISS